MVENNVKDYILKYKYSYSKEQTVSQLKTSGVNKEEI